jgi:hypothetical protein
MFELRQCLLLANLKTNGTRSHPFPGPKKFARAVVIPAALIYD